MRAFGIVSVIPHLAEALFAVFADSDLERQSQRMQEATV
jgi:hypothetical protein